MASVILAYCDLCGRPIEMLDGKVLDFGAIITNIDPSKRHFEHGTCQRRATPAPRREQEGEG